MIFIFYDKPHFRGFWIHFIYLRTNLNKMFFKTTSTQFIEFKNIKFISSRVQNYIFRWFPQINLQFLCNKTNKFERITTYKERKLSLLARIEKKIRDNPTFFIVNFSRITLLQKKGIKKWKRIPLQLVNEKRYKN